LPHGTISPFTCGLWGKRESIYLRAILQFGKKKWWRGLAEGTKVKFDLFNEKYGLIEKQIRGYKISIPREFWFSKDNRWLIDVIDHELVHLDDFVSGRALKYAMRYNPKIQEIIMDYKAYSENQYYNIHNRVSNMRIDYSAQIKTLKDRLPYGWWNIK
jgi:hypothetical protein